MHSSGRSTVVRGNYLNWPTVFAATCIIQLVIRSSSLRALYACLSPLEDQLANISLRTTAMFTNNGKVLKLAVRTTCNKLDNYTQISLPVTVTQQHATPEGSVCSQCIILVHGNVTLRPTFKDQWCNQGQARLHGTWHTFTIWRFQLAQLYPPWSVNRI